MTDPMTPPDCDLRGLAFMPLDVVRLGDSDLVALSTGEEFKAAVMLWCKAWLQVPAASLPDDDRILAYLSGAGPRWAKVKAVALRGWMRCADGRLYHPVIAEKALDAWERRQEAGAARDAHAEKMRRWREAKKAKRDQHGGGGGDGGVTVTRDGSDASRDAPVPSLTGTGTVTVTVHPPSPPSVVRSPRGCRLPDDWQPDADDAHFAIGLGLDCDGVAANFRDYWHAKAGKDATKLDWSATWRGWCRREADRGKRSAPASQQSKLGWMLQ